MTPAAQIALAVLDDPQVAAAIAKQVGQAVREALAESAADAWLAAGPAAAYVYGRDDRQNAFRVMVSRHPDLAAMAVGVGKRRRWKRSDLDQWLAAPAFRRS